MFSPVSPCRRHIDSHLWLHLSGWSPSRHHLYPVSFRRVVRVFMLCRQRFRQQDRATLPVEMLMVMFTEAQYVTFRLNIHHFDRFELDLHGHVHMQGATFSCFRLKLADIVLI